MKKYHLAQINIADSRGARDEKIMKGFVDRLDEINAIADSSAGLKKCGNHTKRFGGYLKGTFPALKRRRRSFRIYKPMGRVK